MNVNNNFGFFSDEMMNVSGVYSGPYVEIKNIEINVGPPSESFLFGMEMSIEFHENSILMFLMNENFCCHSSYWMNDFKIYKMSMELQPVKMK